MIFTIAKSTIGHRKVYRFGDSANTVVPLTETVDP